MNYKIKFVISYWRVKKGIKPPPKPIKGSRYFHYLSEKGAFK